MSYSQYIASVGKALRDRVLPKLEDSEARNVLEASIRALAGLENALDPNRETPPLGAYALEETPLAGPPENGAVRPKTAVAISAASQDLADGAWLRTREGRKNAAGLIAWERARMAESVSAMLSAERAPKGAAPAKDDALLIKPAAVQAYLAGLYGPAVKVVDFRQATGGRSRQTALFRLEGVSDLPANLVVQRDHPAGISPQSVADELPILQLLEGSGLKAPRMFLAEHAREPLGAPFVVMEQLHGVIAGPDYFDPPKDKSLARQLGAQLALLHAVDASSLNLKGPAPGGWSAELDRLEETWRGLHHWPSINATAAIAWMRAHVGAITEERSLVHNDAAFHNILVKDGQIAGLLDWELVHFGHPAEDLGYCRPFIQEMGAWPDFLQGYVEGGGQRFATEVVDYFSLRALLHLTTLLQNGGRRMFEAGVTDDINLAEVGASFLPKLLLRLANVFDEVLRTGETN